MRLRLITLIPLCLCLMTGQTPNAEIQEGGNIQPGFDKGKVARSQPDNEAQPPHTFVGIRCKQINVGTEIKFLPDRKFHFGTVSAGNFVQRLTLMDTGNIGIGIINPAYRLDVQGGQINTSGGLCIAGDCKTS